MWNLDAHPVLPSRSPMCNLQVRRQRRIGLPLLLTFATCTMVLGGCSSILAEGASAGAGVASASIAHGVTDNAAVVTGIGLGVQAAARAGVQFAERKVHQAEQ